jgi:hypothetical protein
MNIRPTRDVAADYGLTERELAARIRNDRQFRQQIASYKAVWDAPTNARQRIQVKSAVLVEDALPALWNIMTDPDMHPSVRLDTHKHLAKLADVEPVPKDAGGPMGGGFSVVINLPGEDAPMRVVSEEVGSRQLSVVSEEDDSDDDRVQSAEYAMLFVEDRADADA